MADKLLIQHLDILLDSPVLSEWAKGVIRDAIEALHPDAKLLKDTDDIPSATLIWRESRDGGIAPFIRWIGCYGNGFENINRSDIKNTSKYRFWLGEPTVGQRKYTPWEEEE